MANPPAGRYRSRSRVKSKPEVRVGVIVAKTTRTLDRLRALCLAYPETSETSSWGHPNFKAGKKVFVAFEQVNGRASIAFRLPPQQIDRLLSRKQFFVTPYGRGQWVSLWADGALDWKAVADLVDRSYRVVAIKRMIAAIDEGARKVKSATQSRPRRHTRT
jgi:predicted DNA-binding protein (MmcQ/YjbR family)